MLRQRGSGRVGRLPSAFGAGGLARGGLCVLVALGVLAATASAVHGSPDPSSLPPVSCDEPYVWCSPITQTTGSGPVSAPVPDTAFNPLGRSYSYVTEGATLEVVRNVADPTGSAGAVAWSWHTATNAPLTAPTPVLLSGGREVVFVGSSDGFLYELDAATGGQIGGVDTHRCVGACAGPGDYMCASDELLAPPTVQLSGLSDRAFDHALTRAHHSRDDVVYVATADGCSDTSRNRVLAFIASDLTPFWIFNADGAISVDRSVGSCALDYASDTLYCGADKQDSAPSGQRSLFALDTTSGGVLWSTDAGSIASGVLLTQGRLYVANRPGALMAFAPAGNGAGGALALWSGAAPVAGPGAVVARDIAAAAFAGHVYLFTVDSAGLLTAVRDDGSSASVRWHVTADLGAHFSSTPLLVTGLDAGLYLYVGRDDGTIQQFHAPVTPDSSPTEEGAVWVTPDELPTQVAGPALDGESDQLQSQIDKRAAFNLSTPGQQVAQTFRPSVSGLLSTVQLSVECASGSSFAVQIQRVTGGVPDGTDYATVKVPVSTLPPFHGQPQLRSFTFPTPARLTAGTPYAMVLIADGSCTVYGGPAGNPYPRGNAFVNPTGEPGQWVSAGTHDDLAFETQRIMRIVAADDAGHITRLALALQANAPY